MGITKAEEFTVKDNKMAKYAKALAHPARVAILQLLLKKQTCICGDIVEELPLLFLSIYGLCQHHQISF